MINPNKMINPNEKRSGSPNYKKRKLGREIIKSQKSENGSAYFS